MVFFQAALLIGYAYVHWLHERFTARQQVIVHGALLLLSVQPEGKKRQPASDWARGLRIEEGSPLEEDINNE